MKVHSASHIVLWLIVSAIAVWTAVYFILHIASPSFQEGAMGNLFATILGVVVGIPIALELSRRQQFAEQAASASERLLEAASRKHKVLSLLRTELLSNKQEVFVRRKPIEAGEKRSVNTGFLRDVMWTAFSDGGELHFVGNPDVLSAIATAYHEIRATIYLERGYIEAVHYPGMKFTQEKYPQHFYLEYLTAKDEDLLAAIDRAVTAIDAELTVLASMQ